jgi:lactam utilization protein B
MRATRSSWTAPCAWRARGVDVGAHVGFPDLSGFGRRPMQIETKELVSYVLYQLSALDGMARTAGHRMTHMSFHGALGNMAAADAALADPLVRAVADFDPSLIVSSSASRAIEDAAERCGLRVRTTFLADRACDDDGLLVPRKLPDGHPRPRHRAGPRAAAARRRQRHQLHRQEDPDARAFDPAARRHARRGGAGPRRARGGRAGRARGADFEAIDLMHGGTNMVLTLGHMHGSRAT